MFSSAFLVPSSRVYKTDKSPLILSNGQMEEIKHTKQFKNPVPCCRRKQRKGMFGFTGNPSPFRGPLTSDMFSIYTN